MTSVSTALIMYTIAKDEGMIDDLPRSTQRQRSDTVWRLEWMSWNTNLAIFLMALIGLVVALVTSAMAWAVVCGLIMALTFVLGQWFTDRVPNAHLTEFQDALAHGEILLMVDMQVWRVKEIEDYVHKQHPEAAVGGVGWTIERLGI